MTVLQFTPPVAPDSAAAATFVGAKVDMPFPSMDEWLDRARNAYLVYRFGIAFHELNDRELEEKFRGIDDFDALAQLMTSSITISEREKEGVGILDSIVTRNFIVGCQIYGEDAMRGITDEMESGGAS